MESIGEKIRQIRKSKGISQTAVADACNIKQSSYANIESGKTQNITIEIGKGISKALGVSFNELFEIEIPVVSSDNYSKALENIEMLIDSIKEKNKLIEQKDLLIEMLQKEINLLKKSAVQAITDFWDFKLIDIDRELNNSDSESEKQKLLLLKDNYLKNKERMIENLIITGFTSQQVIDNYYESLKDHKGLLEAIGYKK